MPESGTHLATHHRPIRCDRGGADGRYRVMPPSGDPRREAFDLLSCEEIVLMLIIDPAWQLPHGTNRRHDRMAAAMNLFLRSVTNEQTAGLRISDERIMHYGEVNGADGSHRHGQDGSVSQPQKRRRRGFQL